VNLDEILQDAGKHKRSRRRGRGIGSGLGKTSGRGHKGWGARSGTNSQLGFAGGTNPILSRIPKRGFSNAQFRKDYQVVNVAALDAFKAGTRVDAAALAGARLIQDATKPVKILAGGELKTKLTVVASKFSAAATEKITQAGGTAETV